MELTPILGKGQTIPLCCQNTCKLQSSLQLGLGVFAGTQGNPEPWSPKLWKREEKKKSLTCSIRKSLCEITIEKEFTTNAT